VIQGRQCHSAIPFNNKIYVFGGCFQFNRKRQVRECTNQVLEYDLEKQTIDILKTKGVSIGSRKNHTAVPYKGSMIIYGGQTENGMVSQDMIVYHMMSQEWVKLQLKPVTSMPPVIQGGACAVIPPRNLHARDTFKTRKVRFFIITNNLIIE
jgi:hypothetical protein